MKPFRRGAPYVPRVILAGMPEHAYIDGRHDDRNCLRCALYPPLALCKICRRSYHDPTKGLMWYANAFGRSTCMNCRN